jgi:predicted 2-oxoglutarate/Fe(II)-dependent dioxygenase YbiX
MNLELGPQVRVWQRALSRPDCLAAIRAMDSAGARVGTVLRHGSDEHDPRLRTCSEHLVGADRAAPIVTLLRALAAEVLAGGALGSRAAMDGPKFCRYGPGQFFRAHRDRSDDPLDPPVVRTRILSLVCLLNDSDPSDELPVFDGGALVLHLPRADGSVAPENVPPAAGSVIAFPPSLLHEVRPVRSGVRYSAIAWVYHTDGLEGD